MDPQLDEPDLRSYLGVIARRRWLVVATALLFVGVAVAASLIPSPRYRVRAQVLTTGVNDPIALIYGAGANTGDLNRQASSELAFLTSTAMQYAAAQAYNGSLDNGEIFRVGARALNNENPNEISSVVELSLVSSHPEEAATLVNVYAQTYVALRANEAAEQMIQVSDRLNDQLRELEAQIAEVRQPISQLEEEMAGGNAGDDALDRLRSLQDERAPQLDSLNGRAGQIRTQISNLSSGVDLAGIGGAKVLSIAGVPDAPISPNLPLNLAIGLLFGLFLGIALAFLRDYFDDSVKTKEVVEKVTGVSTLGLIPKFEGSSELVTVAAPSSPAAEAVRSVRTAVKFLGVERQVRVVQVTSPSPSEGKTFTAVNLAVAFAQAGDRVVVVGGDLRRPRLEGLLDVELTPGLTGVLIGDVTLPQAIRTVGAVPNLSVLPAGHPPPNPSELLSGERARRLIEVLGQTYDIVIIDCAPVLPVTDSLVLARMVDITLLVTSANKTSKRGLTRAVELLRQVGAPLAGTVLNSLSPDATFLSEPYRYDSAGPSRRGRRLGYGESIPDEHVNGRRRRRGRDGGDSGEWGVGVPQGPPALSPPNGPQHGPPSPLG